MLDENEVHYGDCHTLMREKRRLTFWIWLWFMVSVLLLVAAIIKGV